MNKYVLVGAGLLTLLSSPTFSQDVNSTATPDNQAQNQPNSAVAPAPAPVIIEQGTTANTPNPTPQNSVPNATSPNNMATPPSNTATPPPSNTTTTPPGNTATTPPAPDTSSPQTPEATTPPSNTSQTTASPSDNTSDATTQAPITSEAAAMPASETPSSTTATTPAPSAAISCDFKIPENTGTVDSTTVMQWAEKAAQLTFTLDPAALTTQLDQLKHCYTEQGWQSFSEALKKSGNLEAIRKENLTVSSLPDGTSSITSIKDNQWKVAVPLQVVYQNGKEKILQSLTINLIVSRQGSGQLGIMQVVAMQRQTANELSAPPQPEASKPAASQPGDSAASTPASTSSPATEEKAHP